MRAENLALGKTARQISNYLAAARAAVDGDTNTASCTGNNTANPWWSVDLGQYYYINRVTVTFPTHSIPLNNACNYRIFCVIR